LQPAGSRGDGVVQHDVTVLVPKREIVGGQYRIARLHRRKLALDFVRVVGARDGGIDARDPHRLDAAGGGQDPALEFFESRRVSPEITRGLFEPEPGGMNDEMVEVPVMLVGGQEAALPSRHGARPIALELIDAERADLGRIRQRWGGPGKGSVHQRHDRPPVAPG
jgi:hypothetical protein